MLFCGQEFDSGCAISFLVIAYHLLKTNDIPGQGLSLHIDISTVFPVQVRPVPTGAGLVQALLLCFCPMLQVVVQELQADHDAQSPFTGKYTTMVTRLCIILWFLQL